MIEVSIGSVLTKIRRAGKLKNADYQTSGRYPVIDQGVSQVGGYSDDESLVHFSPLPVVIFGDHTRRVKLAKEPFICGADGTRLLYPTKDFDPVYFFYAVKNVDLSNYHYARHFKFLKDQSVIKHDKPAQQRIARILAAYDDLIENNLKRIKLLEEMAQITYEEWFIRLRFPGYESTPLNPETGLPEGWEVRKVGKLIGKPPKSTKIKSSEIQKSGLIPVVDQSRKFVTGYTDNLKSLINTDYPAIIFGDHTRVLKFINFPFARGADGTQVIISNEKRMPQHLFYHALLNLDLSDYHYARHYKFLKELEVIVPDEVIATEYEIIAEEQFEAIKNLYQQNENLRRARDILLPRLMTGVIDVGNYNPAELLQGAA